MKIWEAAIGAALLLLMPAALSQSGGKQSAKPQIGKLKSDLGTLHTKRDKLRNQLNKTRGQVRQVKGDLRQLDDKLVTVSSALEHTTAQLGANKTKQARLAEDLAQTTARLNTTRDQVRQRLRWMYTHGDETIVSALVSARDLSEVASHAFLIKRIALADRKLFNSYIQLRDETADKKQRQDQLVTEISGLKHVQESQKSELNDTRQDKAAVLGGLVEQQKDLERLMRQLDAEEASIAARIAAYYRGAGKTSGLKPFTGRFSKPVGGGITSGYGMRYHPILHKMRMHTGIDFGSPRGAPIHAAADGVVILSTYSQGYGNEVVLDHGGGISTLYGHCSKILVSAGQKISRGDVVGLVGATGLATGPHLHFEVRVNGRPVNPVGWL